MRVIVDSRARLPLDSHLVRTAREVPTLIATTPAAALSTLDALRARGCEVLTVPADDAGRPALPVLLAELGRRRWTNLLVEGGAEVLGTCFDARVVDEVHVFLAPKLLGGAAALTPVRGEGVAIMADALRFHGCEVTQADGDLYWHGWLGD
jgi:diaminohydroxyphosphoribosylaminopyrimidine deaminase/5-amino-6-(5-phosphoribosylamino)uracil reductase